MQNLLYMILLWTNPLQQMWANSNSFETTLKKTEVTREFWVFCSAAAEVSTLLKYDVASTRNQTQKFLDDILF
jgi:hypothetical protein